MHRALQGAQSGEQDAAEPAGTACYSTRVGRALARHSAQRRPAMRTAQQHSVTVGGYSSAAQRTEDRRQGACAAGSPSQPPSCCASSALPTASGVPAALLCAHRLCSGAAAPHGAGFTLPQLHSRSQAVGLSASLPGAQ